MGDSETGDMGEDIIEVTDKLAMLPLRFEGLTGTGVGLCNRGMGSLADSTSNLIRKV